MKGAEMAQVLERERERSREVYIHETTQKLPQIQSLPEPVIHLNGNGKSVHAPDPRHDWLDDLLVALSRPRGPYTVENAEEYLDEEPVELYNGWLVVDEMSHFPTKILEGSVLQHMGSAARLGETIQVLPDQMECLLSDETVLKPDLSLISKGRIEERVKPHGPNNRQMLMGCPELVVEIRSPSNRRTQEEKKRELYFKDGAEVIWDVDEDNEVIHVYQAEMPEVSTTYSGEDEIDCEPFLPGWRRKVSDLFSEDATVEVVFKEVVDTFRDKGEKIGEQRGKKIGREEGEKIGEQRGRKIGEQRTKQDMLIRLLQVRFPDLSEHTLSIIKQSQDMEQLDSWFNQALTAQSLDELSF